jgi:hypothetical protein
MLAALDSHPWRPRLGFYIFLRVCGDLMQVFLGRAVKPWQARTIPSTLWAVNTR